MTIKSPLVPAKLSTGLVSDTFTAVAIDLCLTLLFLKVEITALPFSILPGLALPAFLAPVH